MRFAYYTRLYPFRGFNEMRATLSVRLGCCAASWWLAAFMAPVEAVTVVDLGDVETGNVDPLDGDRPFFPTGYSDGTRIYNNARGFSGTAATPVSFISADSTSTVTGVGLGIGGDDYNGLPLGVTFNYGLQFQATAIGAGHVLADAGNVGLGVSSPAEPANLQLNAGEQLLFDQFQVINVAIQDPLGLLAPGASVNNPRWRGVRSSNHAAPDSVTVSSDAAATQNVTVFDDAPNKIENNLTVGVFPPMSTAYVTTTAGSWTLKSIGWQVDLNYELAPVPASRRTYKFNDPLQNGLPSLAVMDQGTTLNITPVAVGDPTPPSLVINTTTAGDAFGLGVASTLDDAQSAENQRRIDGLLGEAIQFSFDQDVTLESISLDNLNLNGTESMVLSLASGTNPFVDLSGYSGDYALAADSLTYTTSAGGRRPSVITFGMNGQDAIEIAAGTVLSLTANPAAGGGFLLDMITAHVSPGVDADADFDDDGDVDAGDLATWNANFGSAATDATGDANGDGLADGADFLQWQREVVAAPGAAAIPEPASAALAVVGCGLLAAARRRRAH